MHTKEDRLGRDWRFKSPGGLLFRSPPAPRGGWWGRVLLSSAQHGSSFSLAQWRHWANFPSPRVPSSVANYFSVHGKQGIPGEGNGILENVRWLEFSPFIWACSNLHSEHKFACCIPEALTLKILDKIKFLSSSVIIFKPNILRLAHRTGLPARSPPCFPIKIIFSNTDRVYGRYQEGPGYLGRASSLLEA